MNTRAKFILTYLGGVITGIVLVMLFGFLMAVGHISNSNAGRNDDVQLFDSPKQVIDAESFKVMQVLSDGSALATYDALSYEGGTLEYGTVVMFLAEDGTYYDDQVISLPKGKCFRQIGTYRYMTRQDVEKTVPVLGIYDK